MEYQARIVLLTLLFSVPHRYYDSLQFAIANSRKVVLNTHPVKGGINQVPYYINAIRLLYYTVLSYIHNVVFTIASVF